jgi:phosphatidate cytidylyltransferase
MGPHIKRWITGIIAVPILVTLIIYAPPPLFDAFIILIILVAATEYNRMIFGEGRIREKTEIMAVSLIIPLAVIAGDTALVLAVVVLFMIAVFALHLLQVREGDTAIASVANVVFGSIYIPLTLSHFILVRRGDGGVVWIFFILVLAFAGDIAAFYVGRTWGRRKLLPAVSPGKTEEGMYGLIAGSTIACIVFQQIFLPQLPVVHAAVLGCVGSIIGQLGDLCESAIKRASGFKDSGALLPGHGGLLDRLDCLIFIVPFVYYYRTFLIA